MGSPNRECSPLHVIVVQGSKKQDLELERRARIDLESQSDDNSALAWHTISCDVDNALDRRDTASFLEEELAFQEYMRKYYKRQIAKGSKNSGSTKIRVLFIAVSAAAWLVRNFFFRETTEYDDQHHSELSRLSQFSVEGFIFLSNKEEWPLDEHIATDRHQATVGSWEVDVQLRKLNQRLSLLKRNFKQCTEKLGLSERVWPLTLETASSSLPFHSPPPSRNPLRRLSLPNSLRRLSSPSFPGIKGVSRTSNPKNRWSSSSCTPLPPLMDKEITNELLKIIQFVNKQGANEPISQLSSSSDIVSNFGAANHSGTAILNHPRTEGSSSPASPSGTTRSTSPPVVANSPRSRLLGPSPWKAQNQQDGNVPHRQVPHADIFQDEADAHVMSFEFKKAIVMYKSCIRQKHHKPATVLQVRLKLAVVKAMSGTYSEATTDLISLKADCEKLRHTPLSHRGNQHMENQPDVTFLYYKICFHLSEVRFREGDFRNAVEELEEIPEECQAQTNDARELRISSNMLLGLAHASEGNFEDSALYLHTAERISHELRNDISGSTHSEKKGPNMSNLDASLRLSTARVWMMRGYTQKALGIVEDSVSQLMRPPATGTLLSLESRSVQCSLLAALGRLEEAKTLCLETIDLWTKCLDRGHPLMLELTHTMVDVYRLQSFPLEALASSEQLWATAQRGLGSDNQQTFRYAVQKASIELWLGNHFQSRNRLKELWDQSKEKWGGSNPWALSCAIEYCYGLSLCGHLSDCKSVLEEVFRELIRFHNITGCDGETSIQLIDYLSRLLASPESNLTQLHPILLDALGVWAKNELANPELHEERRLLVRDAQVVTLRIRQQSSSFGENHLATLQARLDLANTLRASQNAKEVKDAMSEYNVLIQPGHGLEDHPIFLLAKQGLYLLSMAQSSPISETDTDYFLDIPNLMRDRLGGDHPDTLRALLVAFAATWYIDDKLAADWSSELLQRLCNPYVRHKRTIECIQLQQKLGLVHHALESKEQAVEIFSRLRQSLEDGEGKLLCAFDEGRYMYRHLMLQIKSIVGEDSNQVNEDERAQVSGQV